MPTAPNTCSMPSTSWAWPRRVPLRMAGAGAREGRAAGDVRRQRTANHTAATTAGGRTKHAAWGTQAGRRQARAWRVVRDVGHALHAARHHHAVAAQHDRLRAQHDGLEAWPGSGAGGRVAVVRLAAQQLTTASLQTSPPAATANCGPPARSRRMQRHAGFSRTRGADFVDGGAVDVERQARLERRLPRGRLALQARQAGGSSQGRA